ncbi:putative Ca-activated chloride channel family protein [Blattamonas nauphoetae]|uniref:Ca-activated chloride channel family protein n=1 Tax=Blattamonas nauphoetae TaxID=2049346 RepID=A0ABQ9X478_9EUKA|nr:putative Ca-activated chloride channel family protein [Blattamonas nauphoetae]
MEIKVRKSNYAITPQSELQFLAQAVFEAPKKMETTERSSVSIVLVIDKSGSMSSEGKLDFAKIAARNLVEQLTPTDSLGIVAYDSSISNLVQIGPVSNKDMYLTLINTLQPGSCTNLSGGLQAGIEMLRAHPSTGTRRVFLLSDGQANEGDTSVEGVNGISSRYRSEGISVSSIGLGRDFNEQMMKGVAEHGGGQYFYVDKAEILPGIFASELNLAQNTVTFNTKIWMEFNSCVTQVKIPGYTTTETVVTGAVLPIPIAGVGNKRKIEIKMGDFGSEEKRTVFVELVINANTPNDSFPIGTVHASYSLSSDGPVEEHISAIDVIVTEDEERIAAESENTANSRAIQAVRKAKMDADAEETRKQALIELERGRREEAERLLREQAYTRAAFRSEKEKGKAVRKGKRAERRRSASPTLRKELDEESEDSMELSNAEDGLMDLNDNFDQQLLQQIPKAVANPSAMRNVQLAHEHFAYANAQGFDSYQVDMQDDLSYF